MVGLYEVSISTVISVIFNGRLFWLIKFSQNQVFREWIFSKMSSECLDQVYFKIFDSTNLFTNKTDSKSCNMFIPWKAIMIILIFPIKQFCKSIWVIGGYLQKDEVKPVLSLNIKTPCHVTCLDSCTNPVVYQLEWLLGDTGGIWTSHVVSSQVAFVTIETQCPPCDLSRS